MVAYNMSVHNVVDMSTQAAVNRFGAEIAKVPGWVVGKRDQTYIGMYLDLATKAVKRTLTDDSPSGLISRIASQSMYPPSISMTLSDVDESIRPWEERDIQSISGYRWLLSRDAYH